MPSEGAKSIDELYNFIKAGLGSVKPDDIPMQRVVLEALHSVACEPTEVMYENVKCPGSAGLSIWCKPLSATSSRAILYLHGGAGFAGSPSSHRKMAGHLGKAVGCNVLVLDYRLAPEHPFPEGLDDAFAAYNWLLETGLDAKHIATVGDSAGGSLAVGVVLKAKELGRPLPAVVASFSPWFDMEQSGDTIHTNVGKDLLASPETFAGIAAVYLGGASPKDPLANPLYGDFTNFPPLYLSSGGAELLADNATRLAVRAKKAGVDVKLVVEPEMQHVYTFMAGTAPEADKTIADAGQWIKKYLEL